MKIAREWLVLTVLLLGAAYSVKMMNQMNQEHAKKITEEKRFLPPPKGLKAITFGYDEVLADSLWLRWLQDPEACAKPRISRQFFEESYKGFVKHKKPDVVIDVGYDRNVKDVCMTGWSFLMLDAITDLAPRFRAAYVSGGIILSVIVDDHEGAEIIFDKAMKQYPGEWKFQYQAAYLYLFELDDVERAANMLVKVAQNGGPPWTQSLASRLYTKAGQVILGLTNLKAYRETVTDQKQIAEIDERIRALEKELAQSNSSK